jgi:hypothetical protein
VFITNSGKEYEMFNALKAMSQGLLNTNRATFSDLISLYKASSSSELEHLIKSTEEKMAQQEQQTQQAQLEAQAQAQQAAQDFEFEKQAREHEHEVLIAQIDSFKFQKDQDLNRDSVPDQLQVSQKQQEISIKERKLSLEEKRLAQEKALKEKELSLRTRTK